MSFPNGVVVLKPIAEWHATIRSLSHLGKGKRPAARCLIQKLRARSTLDRTGPAYMARRRGKSKAL